ncbi:monocarboxylate transporter [Purpureocillium lilacinum]|uniref:Monocarboxylate transporter n=1 Tax=Purpureocillium lilacinum TaxID=33203 RepID=A0A179GJQ2_PURLI|nr:monocarboxylate transporter [Purpureocillium lilacinum]OAQ78106.1 monocarboxylate transporter [Purpureocillium lilacinum]
MADEKDASSGTETPLESGEPKWQDHDGWRGWIVVAASACSLFIYMGVIYSWGILQSRIADDTGMSLTSLTFVGSLATSFMCSICIFVGKAIRRFGYRRTAMLGALLLGLGEFLSSWFSGHLGALFVTHGILFGVGGGLTILPCSTAPLKWFRRRRGLATGVVFGGGSLGAAVMGVATNELVQNVGVAWTFRILGFLLWAICLPAACCIRQPPSSGPSIPKLQWHRWKDPEFLIILVGSAVACFPLFIPPYFIPIFARAISHSSWTGIIALSVWNIASTVGRVCAGFAADSFVGPINSFIISLFLCGVSALAIWPFASSIGVLSVFSVVNGIGCGSFFSLFPTCLGAVFGPENTMGVLPIMWASWFFGFFFGTPIASRLYALAARPEVSEYRPAAYYAGATSVVGIVFMLALRFRRESKVFAKV